MSTVNQAGLPRCPMAMVELFGTMPSGEDVHRIKLQCKVGQQLTGVSILTRGATIQQILVPDSADTVDDVVLGFDDLAGYNSSTNFCYGATPGRYANRIKEGKFKLDGEDLQVTPNWTGPATGTKHMLHGGATGYDKKIWEILRGPYIDSSGAHVCLGLQSPDGEEGFPGALDIEVTYSWCVDISSTSESMTHALKISWKATTSATTVVNLTNHSYFNLAGGSSGKDVLQNHVVTLNCDKWTEVDGDAIPTGQLLDVTGTPMDCRKPKTIGEGITGVQGGGYDHNFVVCCGEPETTGSETFVAKVECTDTDRSLECFSSQPGVQFFTMQPATVFDKVTKGKSGMVYPVHGGFCLETQHFPDSPNHAHFPSTRLDSGQTYLHSCTYVFSVSPRDR
mmetsp:Transcript_37747/g.87225  ORF Transcript_37747/g.87225 Transcript_37747/m.87225 type:complete len:394 (+) Transcript_37747:103-1284(+)